jgi:hypothetical protein
MVSKLKEAMWLSNVMHFKLILLFVSNIGMISIDGDHTKQTTHLSNVVLELISNNV